MTCMWHMTSKTMYTCSAYTLVMAFSLLVQEVSGGSESSRTTGIERGGDVIRAVSRTRLQRVQKVGCVEIGTYWKHWIHLLPQHGPGPKHMRPIALEPWQQMMVASRPKHFLTGLVHSDGCRSNNTIKHRASHGVLCQYVYPRYQFTNASNDIRRLFTDTCELLGVRWTQTNPRNVEVSRRRDVEFLDTFMGPKT